MAAAKAYRDSKPSSMIHSVYDFNKYPSKGAVDERGVHIYRTNKGEEVGHIASWQEGPIDARHTVKKYFHHSKYKDTYTAAVEHRRKMSIKHSVLLLE